MAFRRGQLDVATHPDPMESIKLLRTALIKHRDRDLRRRKLLRSQMEALEVLIDAFDAALADEQANGAPTVVVRTK